MDVALICSMFEELPRQGPGSDESTSHAWSIIPPANSKRTILDIGCGTGMQTLTLARLCPDCLITATDLHQPFLNELALRAEKAGVSDRIITRQASMDNLPFADASFDIIWSEGSAFIIGLTQAVRYWKRFVKPDGYLVVSDTTWFTDTPSDECRKFLENMCPDMQSESRTAENLRGEGYSVISSFRLPDSGWWDHYYTPLLKRIDHLKEKHKGNTDAEAIIQGLELEISMHQKYSHEYGYTYFILKNTDTA